MKKLLFILMSSFLWAYPIIAQETSVFNGYKYILISPITYGNGDRDIYGIERAVSRSFSSAGITTISKDQISGPIKEDYKEHPNYFLTLYVSHNDANALYLTYDFRNCNGENIFRATSQTDVYMFHFSYKGAMRSLVSRCNNQVANALYGYYFNPLSAPKMEFGHTDMTYIKAREYIDTTAIDRIEGIYKAIGNTNAYQCIIMQNENFGYDIILTEDLDNNWYCGDKKATIEETSIRDLYTGKWLMYDKVTTNNITAQYTDGLLVVHFGANNESNFLKVYPKGNTTFRPKTSGGDGETLLASGSGFLMSTLGVIGTNNHVIESANKIKVFFTDGFTQKEYNAKVLLTDKSNDVALLQITDSVDFSSIPYGICTTTDIGTEVFTIGFPRPNAMGENFKVTNGIISSLTGIEDDIRAYQITVPIQPGNSGGPLFDMKGNLLGITTSTLSEKYINAKVENVNYAVKISYLLNLYSMLPNAGNLKECKTQTKAELSSIVKKYKNYVCLIKVYE